MSFNVKIFNMLVAFFLIIIILVLISWRKLSIWQTITNKVCLAGQISACTADLQTMVNPKTGEKKIVPSSCSCGEDMKSLMSAGWERKQPTASAVFDSACDIDSDCRLINKDLGYGCCWIGACDRIDYAETKWVAVNNVSFEKERSNRCPTRNQCGPAPGCASQIFNENYQAKCINRECHKLMITTKQTGGK